MNATVLANLPTHDWQFWVASALALVGVAVVLRPFLPKGRGAKQNCPGCPSDAKSADGTAKPKHVDLTIGGKRVRS
ncbi:MAG: hypothetical protein ACO3QC_06930 [Phycisphaerales bacterium]